MRHIIIADDSETARMVVRRCLEIAGCHDVEFSEAPNGEEALEILKGKTADLLVTDLNMPKMDGVNLLKRIKSSPRMHDIPVIVITSVANPKKIEELHELKAYKVLRKPISPAAVAEAIEPLLKPQEK